MASESGRRRASGATQAEEEARTAAAEVDTPIKVEPEAEADADPRRANSTIFRRPSFSRMRFDWESDDLIALRAMQQIVEERMLAAFPDAFQLMYEIYDLVRSPEVNEETGEIKLDRYGQKIWARSSSGRFIEDFGKLSRGQRDHYIFAITTRLFAWEQHSADMWGEAMVAKAQYEERFALNYDYFDGRSKGTVDDRKAWAETESAEQRYFAIFLTLLSRKAEALVRSMSTLAIRLKDSLSV